MGDHERIERMVVQSGITHLPEEFREVARLANRAGLEGWEFQDADIGLDIEQLRAMRERADSQSFLTSFPQSFLTIKYRRTGS